MSRRSNMLACAIAVAAVAGVLALLMAGGGRQRSDRSAAGRVQPAGSHARFVFLASRSSNQCGLQAAGISGHSGSYRLQGSCCSTMNEHAYGEQVRGLRAYGDSPLIPPDPYDIPASLAKRLLRYDRTISLRRTEARTYARAMAMSDQKGPCCCRCWRWNAFRGLAKVLIAERRWRSRRLATLVDLLSGCGGPGHFHSLAARA